MEKQHKPLLIWIIVITIAILAGLFYYQKQSTVVNKVTIEKTFDVRDGVKLTVYAALFRTIDLTNKEVILLCSIDNESNENQGPLGKDYLGSGGLLFFTPSNKQASMINADNKHLDWVDQQFSGTKAEEIGGNFGYLSFTDLISVLEDDYEILPPQTGTPGIIIYKLDKKEKGTYTIKYGKQSITFDLK